MPSTKERVPQKLHHLLVLVAGTDELVGELEQPDTTLDVVPGMGPATTRAAVVRNGIVGAFAELAARRWNSHEYLGGVQWQNQSTSHFTEVRTHLLDREDIEGVNFPFVPAPGGQALDIMPSLLGSGHVDAQLSLMEYLDDIRQLRELSRITPGEIGHNTRTVVVVGDQSMIDDDAVQHAQGLRAATGGPVDLIVLSDPMERTPEVNAFVKYGDVTYARKAFEVHGGLNTAVRALDGLTPLTAL